MKQLLLIIAAATLGFAFDYGLKPVTVTEGVYCFFGKAEAPNARNNGNMVNSCFVDADEGWVVIDTGPTFQYAQQAYEAVTKAVSKKPVLYALNTHLHDDHWLGNGFFKTLGATIIGSASMKAQIDTKALTRMERSIDKEAFSGTKIVLPDIYVDESYTLKIAQHSIEIKRLTEIAHTNGDLTILFPLNKIVFVGDLNFSDSVLSLRDGDIKGWLKAIEKVEAMSWEYLVGGHGNKTDKNATYLTKTYLTTLLNEVRAAIADGVEIDAITETVTMEAFCDTPLYDELHAKNVFKAYQLLEWEE